MRPVGRMGLSKTAEDGNGNVGKTRSNADICAVLLSTSTAPFPRCNIDLVVEGETLELA